jgi:photosystem II stability/assembly factor-like uncharacterized protein
LNDDSNRVSMKRLKFLLMALLLGVAGVHAADVQGAGTIDLKVTPADRRASAAASALLGVAQAGPRVVAVGERGVILLSDDGGRSWRQARHVPAAGTLTGVSFADTRHGWAVGHWGLVLHTQDGGETWRIQHQDLEQDQPLLAVHFADTRRGVAVGLWSRVLVTQDGGASWEPMALKRMLAEAAADAKAMDVNLYSLFPGRGGAVYATAEQGLVLRSMDMGRHWEVLPTGYAGSLWAGVVLANGDLLAGGLRGTLLRSMDDGRSWHRVEHEGRSSITALTQSTTGEVLGTGLDGMVLVSKDGKTFKVRQSASRVGYTGALALTGSDPLLVSRHGPCLLASCGQPR